MGNTTDLNSKHLRLHQIALSLHRDGDNNSALRCWKKIRTENPGYPGIDKWIAAASSAFFEEEKTRNTPVSPSVFKTQKDIMDQHSSRRSTSFRFRPKPVQSGRTRIIRHRHVAYIFLVFMLLFVILSLQNKRSCLLVLQPETGVLYCYQGTFFPYGWEKSDEISVGLQPGWESDLEDEKTQFSLLKGIKLKGGNEFDELLIDLYQKLGQHALKQRTIEHQREAIYYFKKIEEANFHEIIRWDLGTAYFNLASLYLEVRRDPDTALEHLQQVKKYIPTYPGTAELLKKITRLPH